MTKLFNSNIANQNLRFSKQTGRDVSNSSRKLASGSRINQASDDAAGLSIATNLNAQIRSKGQSLRNANDGFSVLQIMDSSLNEIAQMVVRMRELSIGAASDTYDDNDRTLMNYEVNNLLSEIDRIAEGTSYMGHKVFSGSEKNLEIQVDTGAGEENKIKIDLKKQAQTPYALGISDVQINTQHRARLALVKLDYALSEITRSRSEVGSMMNRLKSTVQNLSVNIENNKSSHSRIKDTDYAKETATQIKAKLIRHGQTIVQNSVNSSGRKFLKLLE